MKKLFVTGAVSLLLFTTTACEVASQPTQEPITTTPVVDRTPPAVAVETKPAPAPVPVVPKEEPKPVVNLTAYLDESHPTNGKVRGLLNELYDMVEDPYLSKNAQNTAYMLTAFEAANSVEIGDGTAYVSFLKVLTDRAKDHTIHQWAQGDVHMMELFFLARLGMNAFESDKENTATKGYHYYQICSTVGAITMSVMLNKEMDLDRAYQKIDEHLAQL